METQAGFIKQLVAKAEEDTEFRGRLLTDPNAALTEVLGLHSSRRELVLACIP